ncbi:flagellar brake protein [Roseateles chitosanitabidus]|uniref:flagellar brake protein n=1 Tax=Roseateles chitosanitabidus TaxID=65048 RepID=UPI0023534918|nr:flagellar brake protein [Roseateles chitosanitabidus]
MSDLKIPPMAPDASPAVDADFRLDAPGEIMNWLRELLRSQARIQLTTPDGAAIHTVLRSLDTPQGMLTMEAPQARDTLPPILSSDELVATAFLDKIKLQFDVSGLVAIRGEGEVLRAPVPLRIYRFQRRQAYRVASAGQLYPALKLNGADLPRIRVVNVSAGGVALQWPANVVPAPRALEELSGTLELEREVSFSTLLRVQHLTEGEDGAPHHVGCAFVSLAPTAARALQVFIDQAQKRERLMRRTV